MTCQEADVAMQLFLDNDLSESEQHAFQAHIAQCEACARLFEKLLCLHEELLALPKVLPPFSVVDAILPSLEGIEQETLPSDKAKVQAHTDQAVQLKSVRDDAANTKRSPSKVKWISMGLVSAASILFIIIFSNGNIPSPFQKHVQMESSDIVSEAAEQFMGENTAEPTGMEAEREQSDQVDIVFHKEVSDSSENVIDSIRVQSITPTVTGNDATSTNRMEAAPDQGIRIPISSSDFNNEANNNKSGLDLQKDTEYVELNTALEGGTPDSNAPDEMGFLSIDPGLNGNEESSEANGDAGNEAGASAVDDQKADLDEPEWPNLEKTPSYSAHPEESLKDMDVDGGEGEDSKSQPGKSPSPTPSPTLTPTPSMSPSPTPTTTVAPIVKPTVTSQPAESLPMSSAAPTKRQSIQTAAPEQKEASGDSEQLYTAFIQDQRVVIADQNQQVVFRSQYFWDTREIHLLSWHNESMLLYKVLPLPNQSDDVIIFVISLDMNTGSWIEYAK